MCLPKPKIPKPVTPAAAPAAPVETAQNLKMQERRQAKPGERPGADDARGRRSLRTDVKVAGSGSGASFPRMG